MIGTGRFDNLLRRFLQVKALPIAPTVAPEVMPTFPIMDVTPDHIYLRGDFLASGGHQIAAVAAQLCMLQLWNPPDSGRLIVVTAFAPSTTHLAYWSQTALASSTGNAGPRDTRNQSKSPIGVIRHETGAGGVPADSDLFDSASAGGRGVAVISPGWGMIVTPALNGLALVNTAIQCSWQWFERPMDAGEA